MQAHCLGARRLHIKLRALRIEVIAEHVRGNLRDARVLDHVEELGAAVLGGAGGLPAAGLRAVGLHLVRLRLLLDPRHQPVDLLGTEGILQQTIAELVHVGARDVRVQRRLRQRAVVIDEEPTGR